MVVPEIEAIATPMLQELEAAGTVRVVPTARAARLTMDREGIRRLAAETLGLPTSPYQFCDSLAELQAALDLQLRLAVVEAGLLLVGPLARKALLALQQHGLRCQFERTTVATPVQARAILGLA